MKKIFFLLILISSISNLGIAGDSTLLYINRVKKLKEFARWLLKEAKDEVANEGIYYQYDSASNKNWKVFDKAIELFFNKRIVDSVIQDTLNHDNIFAPEFKARMFKGCIYRFSDLSHLIDIDSLKLKPEVWNQHYIPSQNESKEVKNMIIQYFIINGLTSDYLSFTFEENSSKLLFINISEPQGEEGEKLRKYYQSLRKKS